MLLHPDIFRVQAVLAPGRGDAVVEVGARSSHVQLLLIGLSGNVVPGLSPFGQELKQMENNVKESHHGVYRLPLICFYGWFVLPKNIK